jgi:protein SCO1
MKPRWLAACLCALGATATAQSATDATKLDAEAALRDSQAAVGRPIGDHTLLDVAGRPARLADYRGKPLLVSFIYTGCFQVCPTTTRSLSDAVAALAEDFGADKFAVASIGFNQPFDSPQAMRAFAKQMRVDAPNWHFLSPPAESVDALTRDFGFRYVATPAGFDHVLTVSVLDAEGRLYQQVYGERFTREQIGEPLRRLLRNAPLRRAAPLNDLIERVRIICTVYDPETGTYRFKYGLLIEIAGGVTFLAAMVWFFALEWRTRRRLRRALNVAQPTLARASE